MGGQKHDPQFPVKVTSRNIATLHQTTSGYLSIYANSEDEAELNRQNGNDEALISNKEADPQLLLNQKQMTSHAN